MKTEKICCKVEAYVTMDIPDQGDSDGWERRARNAAIEKFEFEFPKSIPGFEHIQIIDVDEVEDQS